MARRALVVDDEKDVQDFVSLVLGDGGFAVDCATDGFEALDKVNATHPDVVVLDLMMPGLDGWTVLRHLRRLPHAPPVVILSAYADGPRALKAGAVACLGKPFLPGELLGACRRALAA